MNQSCINVLQRAERLDKYGQKGYMVSTDEITKNSRGGSFSRHWGAHGVAEVPYYSVSLVTGLSDSKYCVGTPILCCSVCMGPQSRRYRDEGSRFVESHWHRSRARVCCF